jgi:hypothetical protein
MAESFGRCRLEPVADDLERTFLDLYQPRKAAFRLTCEPVLRRASVSLMPQDDEPPSGLELPSKPSRTQEARRIVEEYANDLREILKKLRKRFN